MYAIRSYYVAKSTEKCNRFYYRLKNATENIIKGQNSELNNYKIKLERIPSAVLASQNQDLDRKIINLTRLKNYYFSNQEAKLNSFEQSIRLTDPLNVLKRGFSITKISGKTISSGSEIKIGDELETIIYENKIISKVVKNEKT